MMAPNSSGVVRRPFVVTVSSRSVEAGAGGRPMAPAATWTFWARIAATTSVTVRPRALSWPGSSQMRMP